MCCVLYSCAAERRKCCLFAFLLKQCYQPECVLNNYSLVPFRLKFESSVKCPCGPQMQDKCSWIEGLLNISHSRPSRAAVYIWGGGSKRQCVQRFVCLYRFFSENWVSLARIHSETFLGFICNWYGFILKQQKTAAKHLQPSPASQSFMAGSTAAADTKLQPARGPDSLPRWSISCPAII